MSVFRDPRLMKRQKIDMGRFAPIQQRPSGFTGQALPPQPRTTDGFKIPDLPKPEEQKPKRVMLDDQGRLVDEKGNVLDMKKQSELKINQRSQKETKEQGAKDLLKLAKFSQATSDQMLAKRRFFDPEIDTNATKRLRKKKGAFNFVQEGQFIKRGEILRKKQIMEEFENRGGEDFKIQGETNCEIGEDTKKNDAVITIRKTVNLKPLDPIPEIEWWDQFILRPKDPNDESQQSDNWLDNLIIDKITHYIQHPVPIKNDYVEKINQMVIPTHLTQKEKKRLRKMKRLEKEKDKQEKVKLGLLAPPKPKIKMSNYMKVMGKEAIANPSLVEKQVKQMVEERQQEHLKRNEDNKLTRDQKEAKMKRKHERDIQNNECRVALFRVESLRQPHLKFKVDMNAQQYHLGGFCFIRDPNMAPTDLPNMVLVEGGPRAIKKYKRLMLRRIKWNEKSKHRINQDDPDNPQQDPVQPMETDEQMDDAKESLDRKCFLVWEGVVKKKNFEKWRVVDIRSEGEAKRLLAEKGCEQYWTMIVNFHPERAIGDEPDHVEKALM